MKGIQIFLALLMFVGVARAQSPIDIAKKQIINENYGEARKNLTAYIGSEKDLNKQAEAYYWLGDSYYKDLIDENATQAMQKARDEFNKGLVIAKSSPYCLVGMGKLLLDAKNPKEAMRTFDQAVRASKDRRFREGHPDIYALIGDAWLTSRQKNIDQAVASYTTACDIMGAVTGPSQASLASYYVKKGDALWAKLEAGGAMSSWENAARLDPKNPDVYLKMSRTWTRASKFDLSLEQLDKGLGTDKTYGPLYKDKVEVLSLAGKYNLVTKTLDDYIQNVPSAKSDCPSRLRFVKFLSYQAKDYDRAIAEAKKLLTDCPEATTAHRWIAWSAFEKALTIEVKAAKDKTPLPYGDEWKALIAESNKASKTLIQVVPADRLVYYDYDYAAKTAQRMGNMEEAQSMYKKVIENDSTQACTIYTSLINAFYEQKKYKEGLAMLDEKIAKGCKIAGGEYFYAMYYGYSTKDYAAGIKFADKYILDQPNGTDGYYYKALSLAQTDSDTAPTWSAKDTYEKLISVYEAKPDDRGKSYVARAYNYLGSYYGAQNDLVKAKELFKKTIGVDAANKMANEALQQLGN